MGGPGASVLLRKALTKQQADELEIWLRSITHHLEKNQWSYKFWLNEDAFPEPVSRCLFYFSREEAKEQWDEDEQKQIKEHLGYLPASETRKPSLEEINAYVTALPGKVYASEYTAAAGHRWVSHIVDPVFLRAWMEYPNFRMIK